MLMDTVRELSTGSLNERFHYLSYFVLTSYESQPKKKKEKEKEKKGRKERKRKKKRKRLIMRIK